MSAPTRPYHHGNLREALLQAAAKAIERDGAKGISLRELGRLLGVSHTSPRRHFADKQALLDALAVRGFELMNEALVRAAGRKESDFKRRLVKLSRAYVQFALQHPALLALMFEAKHRADAPADLLAASEKTFANGKTLIAEGQSAGEVVSGDPARLSLILFAELLGLMALSVDGKIRGASVDSLLGDVIERLVLGFQPRS